MLVLVTAPNFLQMFLGWEGVGLCSYLLIGHYFKKPSAAGAAKKAFVVNRIGDLGLIVAIALIAIQFNSLDFATVFGGIKNNFLSGDWLMTTLAALMFLAVVGKSSQFPLHVWLPDAMEGPTPVSAMIHAATMVTAGVYLIVRSGPLFNETPTARNAVIIIGAITLVMGKLLGRTTEPSGRRTVGVIVSGSFFVLVLVNFAWFWPIWTDQLITHREWIERIWFKRWI